MREQKEIEATDDAGRRCRAIRAAATWRFDKRYRKDKLGLSDYSISISDEQAEFLVVLGDGNMSAGVRVALDLVERDLLGGGVSSF